jgi:flavin reductase (DIM6/NTAB) family NADH-FMN oxidoreductase RutF
VLIRIKELDEDASHDLVKDLVVPRPIAWITTLLESGLVNVAPYSCFSIVAFRPLLVCLSFERVGAHDKKATLRNIERTSEFVINTVTQPLLEKMNATSRPARADESKVVTSGLTVEPSSLVRVPRIAESPINLECRSVEIRNIAPRNDLMIAEIVAVHIRDEVLAGQRIDFSRLKLVARMGGDDYTRISDIVHVPRPWLSGQKLR